MGWAAEAAPSRRIAPRPPPVPTRPRTRQPRCPQLHGGRPGDATGCREARARVRERVEERQHLGEEVRARGGHEEAVRNQHGGPRAHLEEVVLLGAGHQPAVAVESVLARPLPVREHARAAVRRSVVGGPRRVRRLRDYGGRVLAARRRVRAGRAGGETDSGAFPEHAASVRIASAAPPALRPRVLTSGRRFCARAERRVRAHGALGWRRGEARLPVARRGRRPPKGLLWRLALGRGRLARHLIASRSDRDGSSLDLPPKLPSTS